MNVLTLILAGGRERRLSILAAQRAKPALPFAGKYRIIDFALSNCVNSGLRRVAVLPDYRPQPLIDHLGLGGPWDLDRRRPNGLFIWQPFRDEFAEDVYRGTAGALYQNRRRLAESNSDVTLVLAGDQVYTMDYRPLLQRHAERGADLTIGVVNVRPEETYRFGMVTTDEQNRVVAFHEKPLQSTSTLGSMGVYVFSTARLLRRLEEDARDPASSHEIGLNLIPRMVQQDAVYAESFTGYWQDVGSLPVYWRSQLDLLEEQPALDIADPRWVIHTRSEERPPVKLLPGSKVQRSLISNGCVIHGQVINSVLSPGVYVEPGAIVRDAIVMSGTVIGADAVVDRCIIDENTRIGAGAQVGTGDDVRPNVTDPDHITEGLTVIGPRVDLPAGTVVGRHCRIDPEVTAADLPGTEIPSGTTVMRALTMGA
ncbi:MAG TPA: glucose-1-phosphate adenylyltransferase family protein [Herpetosiphonaceae bacterium]